MMLIYLHTRVQRKILTLTLFPLSGREGITGIDHFNIEQSTLPQCDNPPLVEAGDFYCDDIILCTDF